jgi:hypothetical protein
MRDLIKLAEGLRLLTLYHGTCAHNAKMICKDGWQPHSGAPYGASHGGQSDYLYMSTDEEDALWFAEEQGCTTVIQVINVPIDYLIVDPEDGCSETVEEEISGPYPGKVALTRALGPEHFILSQV